jgi:hypothetical protein
VSSEDQLFADHNVVSTTLDTVEWQNSALINENVAEEITEL